LTEQKELLQIVDLVQAQVLLLSLNNLKSPRRFDRMTTAAVEGTISSGGGNLTFQVPVVAGKKLEAVSSTDRLGGSGTFPKGDPIVNSNAEETPPNSRGKGQADASGQNEKSSKIPNSVSNHNGFPPREGISDSRELSDSIIDSALLAALRDPRERLGLLKLEQAMIDFLSNSSDGYIEVGGPLNSIVISPTTGFISGQNVANSDRPQTTFQRCILHRLADRFHVVRENGNLHEGYIRLIKLKESRIPKSLLVNFNYSSESNNNSVDETSRSMESMNIAGVNGNNASTTPATNGKPRNRKMKIMKRCSSGDSSRNSNSDSRTPRKGKNFSDKEKAYAEARARIFAEEQGETASSNPGTPASTSAAPSPTSTPPTSQHGSNSNSSLDAAADNDSEKRNASRNNAVNKATWRNRQQEESDPDFQRGGPMVVQPQTYTTADVYAGFASAGAVTPAYIPPQTYYPAATQDATAAYYAGQGVQQHHAQLQAQQQQQQAAYYNAAGRGASRGGRGAYGAANPQQRYYANNAVGNGQNYYQQPQQPTLAQQHYRRSGSGDEVGTNLNSLEEFPSLR
jgi:hypothetical protein